MRMSKGKLSDLSAPKILYYCLILCFFMRSEPVCLFLVCFVVILWLLIFDFLWLPTVYIMFFDIWYYRFWVVLISLIRIFCIKHLMENTVNLSFDCLKCLVPGYVFWLFVCVNHYQCLVCFHPFYVCFYLHWAYLLLFAPRIWPWLIYDIICYYVLFDLLLLFAYYIIFSS